MGGNVFGIGFGELLFLAVLALIVFGPKRIPEIARSVGRFLRQVREATSGIDQEMRQWMDGIEPPGTWLQEEQLPEVSPRTVLGNVFPPVQQEEPSAESEPYAPPAQEEEGAPGEVKPSSPSLPG